MKLIKWATDVIAGNLREARKYIGKAYELRDECRDAADWCRDMAVKHLEFNVKGHDLCKKLIADYAAKAENSPLAPGMKAAYEAIHAGLVRENAEIQAMVQGYK